MELWNALAPVLEVLVGGGLIAALVALRAHRRGDNRQELLEDPLADLFRDQIPR